MDKLLIEGNKITDPEKRYATAREVEQKLRDYVAYGMAVEQNYTAAIRDNVRGFNWDVGNNVRYDLISVVE
jgi:ABC-type transport system substrate-binding protein